MTLGDLRKLAIRQQTRIRFTIANGLECVVNERGVAQVPALKGIPDFDLERELASARTFQLDPVETGPKAAVKPRTLRREELAALTAGSATAEVHDHEDE